MGRYNRLPRPLTAEKEAEQVAKKVKYSRERMRERYPDEGREQRADWRKANPGADRKAALKRKYDITQETWEELFAKQNFSCAVCGSADPGGKAGWCTDHDHVTGKVRGILCQLHNKLLGMVGDDLSGLIVFYEQAAAYFRGEPCITPGGREHKSISQYIVREIYGGKPMNNEKQFKEYQDKKVRNV